MIYVSNKKSVLCKGNFHPAQFYKGDKRIAGYTREPFEGARTVELENCYNDKIYNAKITGNCFQSETPSPETPAPVMCVGDLVTEGEYRGKYKIPITTRGKNILKKPLDISSWKKGTVGLKNYAYDLTDILPVGGTVTLSYECNRIPEYFYLLTDDESISTEAFDGTELKVVYFTVASVINKKYTFTPKEGKSYYLYNALGGNNTSEAVAQSWLDRFTYMQIEYGDTATDYENYIKPHTFDIYLDAPLCKIGAYEDYIDFDKKKVVRKTKTSAFKGTEMWYRGGFRLYLPIDNLENSDASKTSCVSNRFKAYSWSELYMNESLEAKKIGVARASSYINITPAQEIPTVDEWKAQLAAWNDEGKPLTVVYTNTTREEDIILPILPTCKGKTYYEIATGINAGLSGEYKRMEV